MAVKGLKLWNIYVMNDGRSCAQRRAESSLAVSSEAFRGGNSERDASTVMETKHATHFKVLTENERETES